MEERDEAMDAATLASSLTVLTQNIPDPMKKGTITALTHLIGAALDVPVAWLEKTSSRLRAEAAAGNAAVLDLKTEVVERLKVDDYAIDAATRRILGRAYQKQSNCEAVAKETIAFLNDSEAPRDAAADCPDEDWLNIFSEYASRASSDRLRQLWGRVLAGELRESGNFSLSTLRFLSELDKKTAEMFQAVAGRIMGRILLVVANGGEELDRLMKLQEAGLLAHVGDIISRSVVLDDNGRGALANSNSVIILEGAPKMRVSLKGPAVTSVGLQVQSLFVSETDFDNILPAVSKNGLTKITGWALIKTESGGFEYHSPVDLWSAE